jgi:hypothetical protein
VILFRGGLPFSGQNYSTFGLSKWGRQERFCLTAELCDRKTYKQNGVPRSSRNQAVRKYNLFVVLCCSYLQSAS